MISGALFACFLVGLTVASPLRRQEGDGKFGYDYDVKHPAGSSRVHVRAGSDGHRNSPSSDYISDASYVNPHYVEPHYQPNRYGQYPGAYNRGPLHAPIREKVPVYEEHSIYPKPAAYHAHNGYGVYPKAQHLSQSNLDRDPFYDKPAYNTGPGYSSPHFVQQAAIDDSTINYPGKIEQVLVDPKPTYDVLPVFEKIEQIPLEKYTPVIDQQILVDEPEEIPILSQKTLDDKPVFSQVSEDVPPPKIVLVEPESPIVQQSSVDVLPPSSDVKYIDDAVVAQVALDDKPIVVQQLSVDDPVIQTPIDKYPQTSYEPSFSDIDDRKPTKIFAAQPKYQFVPVGPPYQKISHSTEIIHGPPRNPYSHNYRPVKLPPPVPKAVIPQQEYIDEPVHSPSVKLPPPPVTKTIIPQQEYIDEPVHPPSLKLPPLPPPVTKTVIPQQEYIDEPVYAPSVKLPPPPPPVTKTVIPQQEYIDEPVHPPSVKLPPPPPPVTKTVIPQQEYIEDPVHPPSVKLPPPPPPVTKTVIPQQEYIEEPVYAPSVKLPPPPPPVTKTIIPQQEYIDEPVHPPSVKLPPPPPPVTKTVIPQQEYIDEPVHPSSVKLPPPPPVTKSIRPIVQEYFPPPPPPPVTKSIRPIVQEYLPPPRAPVYKSPPLYKPLGVIKAPPYVKGPIPRYYPISHPVKQPYARSYNVKTPYVSKPPLTYVPFTKSPVPYSVKRPYAPPPVLPYGNPHVKSQYFRTPITKTPPVSYGVKHPVNNFHSVKHPKPFIAVKGYPHVKAPPAPPHLSQSSYADEPLLESPPISHSIKHPHKTVPVLSKVPVGNPHVKSPPQPVVPVKKYLPVGHSVNPPSFEPEEVSDLSISPEDPHPYEDISPLEKYPPVSHAFQIAPVLTPLESKSELSSSIDDVKLSSIGEAAPSPLDKYPRVSHAIRLPVGVAKPPTTQVPNLFKAVPLSLDDETNIESPLDEKDPVSSAIILPISEPKVSALRTDRLSHSVRLGAPRNRGRFDEPKQDFPAFPVASAYGYPDPVSEKVRDSFKPRGGHINSSYEPDESESSNSPSVNEAKLEIDRVNKEIGGSFGDRLSGRSRLS